MRRLKTVRRPPIYPKTPGHLPCSSLTHPLPLSSRRPSVSFGGFGFSTSPDQSPDGNPARRLSGADIGEINRLRRAAGYFGLFRGELINRGLWFGLFEDGHLVALAGTEVMSPTYGISLGGRTLVHPNYRGRRYADLVATAARSEADRRIRIQVATIDPENTPAPQRRRRLSEAAGQVLDTSALRRDPVGLASLIRRVLARRRARNGAYR